MADAARMGAGWSLEAVGPVMAGMCVVDGCPRLARQSVTAGTSGRLCATHMMRLDQEERFWSYVEEVDGCWEWVGSRNPLGYGYAQFDKKCQRAHRVAYQLVVGLVPAGLQIDHLCRNPACVNPAHLEPVTARENSRRGESPWSRNARKTHCSHGHPFDEANTYMGDGRRRCRRCGVRRQREYDARVRRRLSVTLEVAA